MHPATTATPRQVSLLLWLIPHALLAAVAVGTLVRLAQVSSELCWTVAPPVVLMAVSYGAGLALWDRMGVRGRHLWLGSLLVVWCWISWVLPAGLAFGYSWLAVPLAILALRMLGDRAAIAAIGLITAFLVVCLTRTTGDFRLDLVAPPAAAVWAAVAFYRGQQRLVRELGQTRDELAGQQREAGRLAERARIARDLHDTLAQELAGNRILLQAAERNWDQRPEAAREQVRVVTEALGASLADTRSIIGDLTPPALTRDDLAAALRDLCTRKGAAVDAPQVHFRVQGASHDVTPDRATALLRVVQGLLANAYEHARAAHVWVTLDHRDHMATTVEVRDDGVGFDAAALDADPAAGDRGFGLVAARDRLAAYGGACTVDSAPGRGTRVLATVSTQALAMTGRP